MLREIKGCSAAECTAGVVTAAIAALGLVCWCAARARVVRYPFPPLHLPLCSPPRRFTCTLGWAAAREHGGWARDRMASRWDRMADGPAELQPASPKPLARGEKPPATEEEGEGQRCEDGDPFDTFSPSPVAQVLAEAAANRRRSLGDLQTARQRATARAGWSAHGRRSFRGQLKPAEADSVKRSIGTGLLD